MPKVAEWLQNHSNVNVLRISQHQVDAELTTSFKPEDLKNIGEEIETMLSGTHTSVENGYFENNSEITELIEQVIDTNIRPALQADGGDCEFRGFENGVVKLKLTGACASCSSSTLTLRFLVRNLLTQMIPEVQNVEQVFDNSNTIDGKGEDWVG